MALRNFFYIIFIFGLTLQLCNRSQAKAASSGKEDSDQFSQQQIINDVFIKEDAGFIYFGNSKLQLMFNKKNGNWINLEDRDKGIKIFCGDEIQQFDIELKNKSLPEMKFRFEKWELLKGTDTVSLVLNFLDNLWIVKFSYTLRAESSLIERGIEIKYLGESSVTLGNIICNVPWTLPGKAEQCIIGKDELWYYPKDKIGEEYIKFANQERTELIHGTFYIYNSELQMGLFAWALKPMGIYSISKNNLVRFVMEDSVNIILKKGDSLTVKDQYIKILHGKDLEQMLRTYQEGYGPNWLRDAIVYQVKVNDFGGNFKKFTTRIPELKDLGINTILFVPIFLRDGVELFPYSTRDYFEIHPSFGTKEDFRNLVRVAHENKIRVLLDFVTVGTGPSCTLAQKHPEWYIHDELGNIASLKWFQLPLARNYNEYPSLHQYFVDVTTYWVKEFEVDGFRMDVASPEAEELFKKIARAIKTIKPDAILLAETARCKKLIDAAFDMHYEYHFVDIYKENSTKLISWLNEDRNSYLLNSLPSRFLEDYNHSARTHMKWGKKEGNIMMTLLTTIDGVPRIYVGQEIGNKIPSWFYGQQPMINWADGDYTIRDFYRRLFHIRQKLDALRYGELISVGSNKEKVFSFVRRYRDEIVIVAINFLEEELTVDLEIPLNELKIQPEGKYILYDILNDEEFSVEGESLKNYKLKMLPYQSRILVFGSEGKKITPIKLGEWKYTEIKEETPQKEGEEMFLGETGNKIRDEDFEVKTKITFSEKSGLRRIAEPVIIKIGNLNLSGYAVEGLRVTKVDGTEVLRRIESSEGKLKETGNLEKDDRLVFLVSCEPYSNATYHIYYGRNDIIIPVSLDWNHIINSPMNLVKNPSFEKEYYDYWVIYSPIGEKKAICHDDIFNLDKDVLHSGKWSLRLHVKQPTGPYITAWEVAEGNAWEHPKREIKPNRSYKFLFWMKTEDVEAESDGGALGLVQLLDSYEEAIYVNNPMGLLVNGNMRKDYRSGFTYGLREFKTERVLGDNAWKCYATVFKTKETNKYRIVTLLIEKATQGTAWFDSVMLIEEPLEINFKCERER